VTGGLRTRMDQLAMLGRRLLPSMFDANSGLFVHKVAWAADGLHASGTNAWYSAISAIGIHSDDSAEMAPLQLDVTTDALVDACLRKHSSIGLIGATTWALATAKDRRTGSTLEALDQRFNPIASSSMELGVTLAGLAAVIDAFPRLAPQAGRISTRAKDELLHRFSDAAELFHGSSWALRPRRLLQRNFTSFASQVYPILGLAQYARASETSPPEQIRRAAERLIAMQGELGQWWWIYSVRTGAVIEGYPVYSVHQDAMAFMALASLENLGLGSYRGALARGLAWVFGDNELGTSLVDFNRPLISRCIQRRGADADGPFGMSPQQSRRVVLSSWRVRKPLGVSHRQDQLEILEEDRPYHLGWVLYARSLVKNW
jgi:hypothetical protein